VNDLLINLLATVVAATIGWLAQWLLRHRKLAREQAFFGLDRGSECVLTMPRHVGSSKQNSVHRRDVGAMVELATIAKDCRATVELLASDEVPTALGRETEFCVGGPSSNERTATHLRTMLPGVRYQPATDDDIAPPFAVGPTVFRRVRGSVEYVLLARVFRPDGGRPVFVISGQTAETNFAAARYLAGNHRTLAKRYRNGKRFCLVLRVVESSHYGPDYAEIAADVTPDAFTAPPAPGPTPAPEPAPAPTPTQR
jgi:hypothetical protein